MKQKHPRNRPPGDDAMRSDRAVKALDLRIAGVTYRQIAAQLDVSEKTAYYDVQDELGRLDKVSKEKAERLRDLEERRLDALQVALASGIRNVGRTVDADVLAALQDATVIAEARTLLAESASRGSTLEEREAAEAWLTRVVRDEHQVEHEHRRRRRRKAVVMKPMGRPKNGRRHVDAAWSPTTLEALERQQQRILHRTAVLEYVLTAEQRNGAHLTLGDALTELLTDISEAARSIGTILRPAPR